MAGDAITVDPSLRFQAINGVGFALTDSSAYLIDQVPNDRGQRDALMHKLFDPNQGIGVSWVRVIIGASDFTVVPRPWYSYRPTQTSAFDIGRPRKGSPRGDLSHIVPLLRQALSISKGKLSIFADPHSAPSWMKGNNDMWNLFRDGCLLGYCTNDTRDVRNQYAQYFVDFIKSYKAQGIPIRAVDVQNEPNNLTDYPGGNFTVANQLDFISRLKARMAAQNPPLRQQVWAGFGTWEAATILSASKRAGDVDGLSYHCYFGPPLGLNEFHVIFPGKSSNETECSQDVNARWPKTIDMLIQSTTYWANVVANWNIALDPSGGPQATCANAVYSFCTTHGSSMTAPVTISRGAASLTREYYEMGHFSKFVRPGAVRIRSTTLASVGSVAFQNTDGSKVLIAHNQRSTTVRLAVNVDGGRHFRRVNLAPNAIATYQW